MGSPEWQKLKVTVLNSRKVCMMAWSVDVTQTSMLNQWACLQGSTEVLQRAPYGPPLQRYLTISLLSVQEPQGQNLDLDMAPFPGGDQPTTRYNLDYFGFLPARNGK